MHSRQMDGHDSKEVLVFSNRYRTHFTKLLISIRWFLVLRNEDTGLPPPKKNLHCYNCILI